MQCLSACCNLIVELTSSKSSLIMNASLDNAMVVAETFEAKPLDVFPCGSVRRHGSGKPASILMSKSIGVSELQMQTYPYEHFSTSTLII